MATLLTPSNITFGIGILAVIFSVYNSVRNPQIKTDQTTLKLQDDYRSLRAEVDEIKQKHLAAIEGNIEKLSNTVNNLTNSVTRLSTIIDERIPRSGGG